MNLARRGVWPVKLALRRLGIAVVLCGIGAAAQASGVGQLSSSDAAGGVKAALSQSITTAVGQLGATDGFLKNPKVAIGLPPALEKADSALRMLGMGGEADQLREKMNHAAESAVSSAAPVLKNALSRMTLDDAKAILTGGDDAATNYFRRACGEDLKQKFRPIVAHSTEKLQVAAAYDRVAGKATQFGLLKPEDASLNEYITGKALDGLFTTMADEERAIRRDPLGQASSLIKKAFGAL